MPRQQCPDRKGLLKKPRKGNVHVTRFEHVPSSSQPICYAVTPGTGGRIWRHDQLHFSLGGHGAKSGCLSPIRCNRRSVLFQQPRQEGGVNLLYSSGYFEPYHSICCIYKLSAVSANARSRKNLHMERYRTAEFHIRRYTLKHHFYHDRVTIHVCLRAAQALFFFWKFINFSGKGTTRFKKKETA